MQLLYLISLNITDVYLQIFFVFSFFPFLCVFSYVFYSPILVNNEILSTTNKLKLKCKFAPFLLFTMFISYVFSLASFFQIFYVCVLHEMMNLGLLMKTSSQVACMFLVVSVQFFSLFDASGLFLWT